MLPHHITSFATLALADNCKLWSGNREMEQWKKSGTAFGRSLFDSCKNQCALAKITLLTASKAPKFK